MADEDELLTAVQANDAGKARAVLNRNPLVVKMRTPNGTLVLTAVYHGAKDALQVLLERTPEDALNLYEAAATGNARRLKTILGQSRARINEPNQEGFTPLGLAAFFGRVEAVRVLLEHRADVNQKPPSRFANTALDAAVAGNHLEVVRVLVDAGADVNVRSAGEATPLHKAAQHGNLDVLRLLLDHGAEARAKREGGNTPLDDAREKGHEVVVEFLRARTPPR